MGRGARRCARWIGAILLCSFLAPFSVQADTVSMNPSKDNTIYESFDGSLSNGAGTHIFAGINGLGMRQRALLAFDVAHNVPAGSSIASASLTLTMTMTNAGDQTVSLHRALLDWGEGTSIGSRGEGGGAAPTTGDATWLHTFYPGQFWSTAGGDYLTPASEAITVGGFGPYSWSSPSMAADVQSWLDTPSTNYGWILVGAEDSAPTSKRFESRTAPDPGTYPVLTIVYTPPASAAGRVPDGGLSVPGPGMTVTKLIGGNLGLTWGPSCRPTDIDYEVYEGTLGAFASHTPRLCSTGGATSTSLLPSLGDRYYLVVPRSATKEGSYGVTSALAERPQGVGACLPVAFGGCN